ncbi:MAG TPA: hypothetical protein VG432_16630 [Gemmatimonadaceae bacterium]|nr:hypothetical protein [Gemmatimonadaceae bacterium]
MNYRSSVAGGAVAAVALAAACTSTTSIGDPRPFSYIDVRELPAGNATGLAPYASAIFVKDRVTGVVPSYALNEGCTQPMPLVTGDGSGVPVSGANLDPGSVKMSLKGSIDPSVREVALTPSGVSNGLLQYSNATGPVLQAGDDSITVAVAGAAGGFPAFTIRTSSVPHFVAQPVDDSIVGQGIRVQWTGLPATTTTRMQISLQYATTGNSSPNMEMRCVALDDGDFTIPRLYLSEWENAGVDASTTPHQAVLSRFNTVGANVADGLAVIVTRIDTTIVK